jgi:hypothetical protein
MPAACLELISLVSWFSEERYGRWVKLIGLSNRKLQEPQEKEVEQAGGGWSVRRVVRASQRHGFLKAFLLIVGRRIMENPAQAR